MYTVYSKPNCTFCDQAKSLLKSKGLAYEEVVLDIGQPKEEGKNYMPVAEFKSKNPNAKTVPQIFKTTEEGTVLVGGFQELRSSLQ